MLFGWLRGLAAAPGPAGHRLGSNLPKVRGSESACLPKSRPYCTLPAPQRPRWDDAALEALAKLATNVDCECPHHLVEILLTLGSFERYSAQCESRTPVDAALHRDLQRTTAQARMLLEDALERVVLAEGLPLPQYSS